jgi:hypothetical protein
MEKDEALVLLIQGGGGERLGLSCPLNDLTALSLLVLDPPLRRCLPLLRLAFGLGLGLASGDEGGGGGCGTVYIHGVSRNVFHEQARGFDMAWPVSQEVAGEGVDFVAMAGGSRQ